jgi:hypothetical protein
MNKIIIPVIAGILILSIGLSQDVYGPDDKPEKLVLGGTGYTKAIPDWVKNQFQWYVNGEIEESTLLTSMNWLFDNNIMHLSKKAAQETQNLRAENEKLRSMVGAAKSTTMGTINDESEFEGDPDRPVIVGSVPNTEESKDMVLKGSTIKENYVDAKLRPLRDVVVLGPVTHGIFDDVIKKGGTESAWTDGIATFEEHGMHESVVDDLQGIVVLCNTEIDKKTQTMDAELKMIEEWLKLIQEKETATKAGRMTTLPDGTTSDSKVQYNESDLDFLTRKLASIDQQISSLDTGLSVLEQKLQTVGDDAQLANIDLQNQLQKQQQTLQTMSNVSKMLHDTAKAIIQNMKA